MEILKHECGIAMVRLLKPLSYYKEKYGTPLYALNKLYLMMEKQHNRGQEGAGLGCIKLDSRPGTEYVFRERALGSVAIQEIFSSVKKQMSQYPVFDTDDYDDIPFLGNVYMGHLRYSTTGKSGISYVHPFLRRNNWKSRNLLLCGNFNMTNVEEIFDSIVSEGQHPRIYSDTVLLLEQLGHQLDNENQRLYDSFKNRYSGIELTKAIEDNIDITNILKASAPLWDGGFAICGVLGSGDMFVLRDRHGIRPAFYYHDDEICVVASERPVIQTAMNVSVSDVRELTPGSVLTISKSGEIKSSDILGEGKNERCSFERIYFSRGSDKDIYHERKQLGIELVPQIVDAVNGDLKNTIFSFIPNTAEVAYMGMVEGLERYLSDEKVRKIGKLDKDSTDYSTNLKTILNTRIRTEKIAIKDIKLRTFIAEGDTRDDLAAHVYDVTYGVVNPGVDNVVVIDDSIVRGTTLKQSIIRIIDRLHPKKIVIVSSSPQVRYPDYYGIDMSRMNEFCAFRAAIELLKESGRQNIIDEVYVECKAILGGSLPLHNCVKKIYQGFTDKQVADKIASMLTPDGTKAEVEIVYQTIDGLHASIPNNPGDWYFSGDYPTKGGIKLVLKAYINYYEGKLLQR